MEINGVAHVILTVTDFAAARAFYGALLRRLGLVPTLDLDGFGYWIGGRTAIGIQMCSEEHRGERFVQSRVGLHHLCLRARSREDVDAVHTQLVSMGAHVVHPPEAGPWFPGYYSVLFEDPDGIRLEVNHVPGRGVLDGGAGSPTAVSCGRRRHPRGSGASASRPDLPRTP